METEERKGHGQRRTTWQLADLADCGSPDVRDSIPFGDYMATPEGPATVPSAGADFLRRVETAVMDLWDETEDKPGPEGVMSLEDDGSVTELADGCVPIYTHELWSTFVDLAAYQEELEAYMLPLSDVDGSPDLNGMARVALYMIAERLAWALLEEMAEEEGEER